ncbi:enoyl-[acyl-carrier-protein] reductase (NADH) [Paenibacillus sp. DS2015]
MIEILFWRRYLDSGTCFGTTYIYQGFQRIVKNSDLPGYVIFFDYGSGKEQFTRQLAKEFGAKQITINAIAPGPVNTELFSEGKSEQQIEAMKKMNAFGRLGEPEDIANVFEFLVSEQAQWVTSQTIRANGGFI